MLCGALHSFELLETKWQAAADENHFLIMTGFISTTLILNTI
jgi:hypothetical protein